MLPTGLSNDRDRGGRTAMVEFMKDGSHVATHWMPTDADLPWVDTWDYGSVRLCDISDPFAPKQIYERRIGGQVNMVSQSWDGTRLYFTSSLLSKWDKTAPAGPELQFFTLYDCDGSEPTPRFSIDFVAAGLGTPTVLNDLCTVALEERQAR